MTPVGIVITSIVPYMLLLIGLGLTVVTDVYISGFHKKLMILILALTASLRDGAELLVRIFVLTNNPVPIGTGLSSLAR